jgi:hypothetical protein
MASEKAGESAAKGSLLDHVGRRLGLVTAIIGIFVTVNATLSTCSKESIDRSTSFRAAVKAEEDYWSQLYREYLSVVGEKDQEARKAKLFALNELAKHEIPPFSEFRSSLFGSNDEQRTIAIDRLTGMKNSLRTALASPQSSDSDVAQAVRFDVQQEAVSGAVPAAEAAGIIRPAATPSRMLSYATQLIGSGPDNGWDLDVFWCAGGSEQAKYSAAFELASQLGAKANAKSPIAPGVLLGKIKLRSLPLSRQEPAGIYPNRGNLVVHDGGKGEEQAARAVRSALARQAPPLTVATSVGKQTPYYLSIFVCSVGGETPAAPAPAEVAAS